MIGFYKCPSCKIYIEVLTTYIKYSNMFHNKKKLEITECPKCKGKLLEITDKTYHRITKTKLKIIVTKNKIEMRLKYA